MLISFHTDECILDSLLCTLSALWAFNLPKKNVLTKANGIQNRMLLYKTIFFSNESLHVIQYTCYLLQWQRWASSESSNMHKEQSECQQIFRWKLKKNIKFSWWNRFSSFRMPFERFHHMLNGFVSFERFKRKAVYISFRIIHKWIFFFFTIEKHTWALYSTQIHDCEEKTQNGNRENILFVDIDLICFHDKNVPWWYTFDLIENAQVEITV